MRRRPHVPITLLLCLFAVTSAVSGQRPELDASAKRVTTARPRHPLAAADRALLREGVRVQYSDRVGLPTFVWPSPRASRAIPSGLAPEQAARAHLGVFAGLYDLDHRDIAEAELASLHDTGRGGIIATLRQRVGGVEVFREEVKILMDRNLDLVAIAGYLTSPPPGLAAGGAMFRLDAASATGIALEDLTGVGYQRGDLRPAGERPGGYESFEMTPGATLATDVGFTQPARAKRVLFRLGDALEPGYYIELEVRNGQDTESEMYAYVVSAADGSLLFRHDLTVSDSFTYRVWAQSSGLHIPGDGPHGDVPTPHPTGLPDGYQAPFTPPVLVTLQNGPIPTNDPWLAPGAIQTLGNNVDAYADISAPDGLTSGDFRATTTSPGTFDRTYDTALSPGSSTGQRMAAITQLFYVNNFLHDWFWGPGFNEISGNAQTSNFGRGGLENDSLRAEAQDHGGRNNANMSTPADGARPRMQMYVWSGIGDRSLTINTPAAIAGVYSIGTAQFGPQAFDQTDEVVLVDDGSTDGGAGTVTDGCNTPFVNAAAIAGKFALVDRGLCSFSTKVLNAQMNGATGVLIANDTGGLLNMGGTGAIGIPSLLITQAEGNAIRTQLPGSTVEVRMLREAATDRDGTIDNQIVAHEWGHFISNRLIGNANGLANIMGRGLGEGWGDFHSMLITVRPEDANQPAGADYGGVYGMAGYVNGGGINGTEPNTGYYFGIRRVPYSTDMTKNPLTFRHIADGQPLPPGVPIAFGADGSNNAEVHNTGEVWATMLWECYTALLRDTLGPSPRLTFDGAQQRMLDYLVAGYKMTPSVPTLIEARDAILSAALANDVTDYSRMVEAFAKRGAGVGAIAPDRYSSSNSPVVESYAWGGDLAFVEATLEDDVATQCIPDGLLDNGETGTLTITLDNTGSETLTGTTATISSPNPAVSFPAGATMVFPASDPFGTTTASIPVSLTGASGIQQLDLSVSYDDPELATAGPRLANASYRGNADDVPGQSAADDVESGNPVWTAGGHPSYTPSPFRRIVITGLDHRWLGPDISAATDTWLVSPPLNVGAGNFSFTFRHRHSFEFTGTTRYDGGVLEISTNGGATWSDIGFSASPGYNGVLASNGGNPLQGRNAWTAVSAGYPALSTVTVGLGTAYAGQTVLVRFRVGTDVALGAPGWEIDDIVFSNITNLPFSVIVPQAGSCDADSDGFFDAQDCSPGDPDLWSAPDAVADLTVTGGAATQLSWSAVAPGGTAAATYDVLRSGVASDFMTATCLETDQPDLGAADPVIPGEIACYLVRARNGCATRLGPDSTGAPRTGIVCP